VDNQSYAFGPFRLLPAQRTLLDDGKPLRLGSRALDLLIALVERAGETVGKDELIARAWHGTVVEEAALRVHVAALRKALGDGQGGRRYIANTPGRGYAFVAPVLRDQTVARAAPVPRPGGHHAIPAPLTRIIGREETIATLTRQLSERRILTIVGAGGIGKTTVAAAVAAALHGSFTDGAWFIELSAVSDAELVPSVFGAALGVPVAGADPTPALLTWLRDRHALLVFDNCEHVVEAAASLAEAIVRTAPRVRILATSREPLRAAGEWRHRLAPLAVPPDTTPIAPDDALRYPAIQLFSERAAASADGFTLEPDDVSTVIDICRRLDGVPLALELAAAHVGVVGIRDLAARLDDRFALLIKGRRTALPQHQTLRAMLDWSYNLLPEAEQVVLRRLAVFQGDFTMRAAEAVASGDGVSACDVLEDVANLADKSLVAADVSGDTTYYRLLELTRVYALERLRESGERDRVMRRHAAHFRDDFAGAEAGAAARSRAEWVADYGNQTGNLRAALAWCFAAGGDAALGVALAAAATDFWIALSLLHECGEWGLKAVSRLGAAEGTREELMLQCGLGQALSYSKGMQRDAQAVLARALALAESLGEYAYQFRAIYGLWLVALRVADFRTCLRLCEACARLGQQAHDQTASAAADFTYGLTRFYLGEHTEALANLQRARETYPVSVRGGDPIRYASDLLTSALAYEAVTLFSLGHLDRAVDVGRDAVREAHRIGHPASLCIALHMAALVFLVRLGLLDEADRSVTEQMDHAARHSLHPYHAVGLGIKGTLAAARGDLVEAERLLRQCLQRSRELAYYLFYANFLGELAIVLREAGRVEEGLTEIDAALRHAEDSQSLWCLPELLRVKGELLAASGDGAVEAETWFQRAIDLARWQRALAWELRAAISLARHWQTQERADQALTLLDSVYRQFSEGFDTADLSQARDLLAELRGRATPRRVLEPC